MNGFETLIGAFDLQSAHRRQPLEGLVRGIPVGTLVAQVCKRSTKRKGGRKVPYTVGVYFMKIERSAISTKGLALNWFPYHTFVGSIC